MAVFEPIFLLLVTWIDGPNHSLVKRDICTAVNSLMPHVMNRSIIQASRTTLQELLLLLDESIPYALFIVFLQQHLSFTFQKIYS
jgi:hypothetical protein